MLWRKGRLHFTPDKAKVNGKLHCEILLSRLVEDCKSLLQSSFIFQQDGAPARDIRRSWLKTGLPSTAVTSSEKNHRTHQTLILLIIMIGELCLNATRHLKAFQPKPSTIDELKKVFQTLWDDLPQHSINKAVLSFIKTSSLCERWGRTLPTRLQITVTV